jgi:hypothetical protein
LPNTSKENIQTKRDTRVLQVGGWVVGPAPHHPEKNTHAKKPRQMLGKMDGIEVDAETIESTRNTEEKLDGRYK